MIVYDKTYSPTNEIKERKLFGLFRALKIVSITLTVLSFFVAMWENLVWPLTVVCLATALIFGYFQYQHYNFYDISFYDGEIKVVKVRNNVKRLILARFNGKLIKKVGIVSKTSTDFKEYKRIIAVDKVLINTIFIVYDEKEEHALFLPYDEGFLSALIKYYGKNKFEKELIEHIKSI